MLLKVTAGVDDRANGSPPPRVLHTTPERCVNSSLRTVIEHTNHGDANER